MDRAEIARRMMRLGAESLRDHVLADPAVAERYGFAVARRAGLWCYSSTSFTIDLFNHVSGWGTFAGATQRALDAVLRHYDRLGRPVNLEVLHRGVPAGDVRLLERNGFRLSGRLFQCHVRTTARPPAATPPGVAIDRVVPSDASVYARLATRGFGSRDRIALVFERGWTVQIERDRRVAAFIGRVGGAAAATGVLIVRPGIAGLYSGSVLPAFRGRGLQNAMVRARLAHGWRRGVRTFYSWTDPESASARNLRDEGFRTLFEVHRYAREA